MNCKLCGVELVVSKNGDLNSKYCSISCYSFDQITCNRGRVKIEDSNGSVLHNLYFQNRVQLLDILNSFSSSFCVVVNFENKNSRIKK